MQKKSSSSPEATAPHDSATTHVTGRSEYVDDRPMLRSELLCGVVYSPHAHARICSINTAKALRLPGVICVLTAEHVHHNQWGPIFQDQPIIAKDHVQFVGETVAVVAATSEAALRAGIKAVDVAYEVLTPILSIDAAVRAKSFIAGERKIERGEIQKNLSAAPHKLKGNLKIQGADHFYLENNGTVVYPQEHGHLEVHSSTQHPTETQHVVAEACGLAFHEVVCIVKRLGGGFGGKESQAAPFAAYAAMVAQHTKRPARIVLSKDDDMIVTGKRNPFQISYDVGFDENGRLIALDAMLHSDGGAYADLSTAIMERAMLHSDNAYHIPHMRVRGQVCKLNFHPHTAFRGFGGPKGVAMIESIIEDIARVTGRDALDIRKLNCYQAGQDETHYGQKIENNVLPELFSTLEHECHYRERRRDIAAFNRDPNRNPRGLSLTAVKFGISFTTRFLNQGNALVNIHRDGTVQVSTGAVEMGQGVNQRIATIVARELGLHVDCVRVMTTSTEKNANTSPTAASSGTDINGAAAQKACVPIKKRLTALMIAMKDLSPDVWASKTAGLGTMPEINVGDGFEDPRVRFGGQTVIYAATGEKTFAMPFNALIREAYLNRISVCEYAHYSIPGLGFDKIKGQGQAFLYYTNGVAASEVELDRWTGEVKVRRVDILMDLGRPVNAGLDLGQVTGAFIQGMGWVTTENLVYDKKGFLLSHSPSTYKIPSIQDTPRIFNVRLLANDGNSVNVHRTKAAGEPPLLLAISTWTAIRDAVMSVRANELVPLQIPATSEQILRALSPEDFQPFQSEPFSHTTASMP